MAIIDAIKQAILRLDAGSFQIMCDRYLSETGCPNIVSLGTNSGTQKTTPGTPDTYFLNDNNKYVFVEYTTQQNDLVAKIRDDINKCLDVEKTGIPHEQIAEIKYFHTSSNIAPKYDKEFHDMCNAHNIKLSILGIDALAYELYNKHQIIAKEHLGISLCTDQIESKSDFISRYDRSALAAPLSTDFLFRNEELHTAEAQLENTNVLIVSGVSGAGKTRFALELSEIIATNYSAQLYCIHDNSLPIHDDLVRYMSKCQSYVLLVDDANQLSNLKLIVDYAISKPNKSVVKIIVTVRDYALSKVKNDIAEITKYEVFNLPLLKDEQIEELVQSSLGIKNELYLNRISKLAAGNARIAMLAGKLACDANRLDSINDISQLYSEYYKTALEQIAKNDNDETLVIIAGVLAFVSKLLLENNNPIFLFLTKCGISNEMIHKSIRRLHELDIIDVYHDKVAKVSEQCLSNYLIKYVFYDKKYIRLKDIINATLSISYTKSAEAINVLINIFHNEDIHRFVEDEVKTLWDELETKNSEHLDGFSKVYYPLNPLKMLLRIKNIVDNEENVEISKEELIAAINKPSYFTRPNDILQTLGGFADTDNLPVALDLFFTYYLKRPDLISYFKQIATSNYGITDTSYTTKFYTTIEFLKKFDKYSDNWSNYIIIKLFLEIAKEFLQLNFSHCKEGKNNTVTMYRFNIIPDEGVDEYRQLIWDYLLILATQNQYNDEIYELLKNYGHAYQEESKPVICADLTNINKILESAFADISIKNCLLAEHVFRVAGDTENAEYLQEHFLKSDKFQKYLMLKGTAYTINDDYRKWENNRHSSLKTYLESSDIKKIEELIDIASEVASCEEDYSVECGINALFEKLIVKQDVFCEALKYYLHSNTPFNATPFNIVAKMFTFMAPIDILNLLSDCQYSRKNTWIYAFYREIPEEIIDESYIIRLYDFLEDDSDKQLPSSGYRDLMFLKKYQKYDNDVILKASRIILKKIAYSPFIVKIYFQLLFNDRHITPQVLINEFKKDIDLLKEIYICLLKYDDHMDYTGEFLKELYINAPEILNEFVEVFISNHNRIDHHRNKILIFFELENANSIIDTIVDLANNFRQYTYFYADELFSCIVMPIEQRNDLLHRQDNWIRHYIETHYTQSEKMNMLFFAISELSAERRIDYIKFYLSLNQNFEDFKRLPLFPRSATWTGSAVTYLSKRMAFLEELINELSDIAFLMHKEYIDRMIQAKRKEIQDEEIKDIMLG